MKFSESLKKNRQFQFVYKNGRSKANKYLVMYVKEKEKLRVDINGNIRRLIYEFALSTYRTVSGTAQYGT